MKEAVLILKQKIPHTTLVFLLLVLLAVLFSESPPLSLNKYHVLFCSANVFF